MGFQSSINNVAGSIVTAVQAKAAKDFSEHVKSVNAEKEAKALEETKKIQSYDANIAATLTEAMATNPKLKDAKYFEKAMQMVEGERALRLGQRESTRRLRDAHVPGSPEYNAIEEAGQARKQSNEIRFKEQLLKLGQRGRPKKGGK